MNNKKRILKIGCSLPEIWQIKVTLNPEVHSCITVYTMTAPKCMKEGKSSALYTTLPGSAILRPTPYPFHVYI